MVDVDDLGCGACACEQMQCTAEEAFLAAICGVVEKSSAQVLDALCQRHRTVLSRLFRRAHEADERPAAGSKGGE